jgi:hypothetical protein
MRGHEQMLGQATAVLVALPTLLAPKLAGGAFLISLDQELTLAGPARTGLARRIILLLDILVLFVLQCAVRSVRPPSGVSVAGQAVRR